MDVPWLKRQEIPDPQVRDAADQYEAARALLDAQPPAAGVLLPLMNTAAVAIELYLKSLSAEMVHVPDERMADVTRVYAAPGKGHGLLALLDAVPDGYRQPLEAAFGAAALEAQWTTSLREVLGRLDGAFAATRYPFERNSKFPGYSLADLMRLSRFLSKYVASLDPIDLIEWKRGELAGS